MDTIFVSKSNNNLHLFYNKPSLKFLEMDSKGSKTASKSAYLEDPYDTIEEFEYDEMKVEIGRLATFHNWPADSPVKAMDLAAAGFFYLGKEDSVKCFSCEVHLKQWVEGDNPFNEHKKHKPHCNFVKSFEKPSSEIAIAGLNLVQPSSAMNSPIDGPHSPQIDFPCPLRNTVRAPYVNPVHQHIEYPPSHRMYSEQPMQEILHPPSTQLGAQRYPGQPSTSVHPLPTQISNHRLEHFSANPPPMQQPIQATSLPPDHLQLPYPAGPYIPPQPYIPSRSNSLPGYHNFSPQQEYGPSPEEPLSYSWPLPVPDDHSDYNARLLSFKHWPTQAILRPTQLAHAGFYYTGFDDGVTCYKCKVSLKGWEPNDTPWGEHKKWSPNCPLVLEHFHTGQQPTPTENNESFQIPNTRDVPRQMPFPAQFLHPSVPRHSSLPIVTGQRRSPVENTRLIGPQHFQQGNISLSPTRHVIPGPPVASTTSQGVQAITPISASTPSREAGGLTQGDLQKVYEMGFSQQAVQNVIETQVANTGSSFTNVDDLVQSLVYHQGFQEPRRRNGNKKEREPGARENTLPKPSTSAGDTSENNTQRELERMQEARLCKICMDADVGVVFLPCGHLVCCPDCAVGMKMCPMCRGDITENIRTYFS